MDGNSISQANVKLITVHISSVDDFELGFMSYATPCEKFIFSLFMTEWSEYLIHKYVYELLKSAYRYIISIIIIIIVITIIIITVWHYFVEKKIEKSVILILQEKF